MNSIARRITTITGVTCAMMGSGAVALAAAAPMSTASSPALPGLSCDVNQGLLPGTPNLGPTGPLGPLGSHGPSGNNNSLPCGMSAFNLGPSGPLGPGA